MLTISLKTESLAGTEARVKRAIEMTAKALARLTAEDASKQMYRWFDIRDDYVTRGLRYKLTSSTGNLAEAVAYHRDKYLSKQVGTTIQGRLAIPSKWADRKHPKYTTRKPSNLLARPNFFKDEFGIWGREGGARGSRKKRLWYLWSDKAQHGKRMKMDEVARLVVREKSQELFDLYMRK